MRHIPFVTEFKDYCDCFNLLAHFDIYIFRICLEANIA